MEISITLSVKYWYSLLINIQNTFIKIKHSALVRCYILCCYWYFECASYVASRSETELFLKLLGGLILSFLFVHVGTMNMINLSVGSVMSFWNLNPYGMRTKLLVNIMRWCSLSKLCYGWSYLKNFIWRSYDKYNHTHDTHSLFLYI